MRKFVTRALGGAAVIGMLLISPATQVAASSGDELAAVRAATAKFHDIGRTDLAGYHKALWCFSQPGLGGMGWHYLNVGRIGSLKPTEPAALVYEVDGTELKLVAVEYIVPYDVLHQPSLFGRPFLHNLNPNVWALHAWIWKDNPAGMFAAFNPKVGLCPPA
jgi:hypothetical protein